MRLALSGHLPYVSTMKALLIFLIVFGGLATAVVLVRGVLIMASGKDVTGHQQNKMMWYRVLFQGITVALLFILALVMGRS